MSLKSAVLNVINPDVEKPTWVIYLINILLIFLLILPIAISQSFRFVDELTLEFLIRPTLVAIIAGALLARGVLLKRALRHKSEQFRAMVDLAHEFSYLRQIDGKYVYVSPYCLKLTGYEEQEFYDNPNLMDQIVHPDDSNLWEQHVHRINNEGEHEALDLRLLSKSGRTIWISHICMPVYNESGEQTGVRSTNLDITAKIHAEAQSRHSQKMDALGKLTGGIAHDFNNMLGVIVGYSELLESALNEQPKLEKYAQNLVRASERGTKLTNKLLSFSRKDLSTADKTDINLLLLNQQDMLEKTLTVRINFELILLDNLWPVWLEASELEDAILNMSINSMHAIEGNGQLTIETSNQRLNQIEAENLSLIAGEYVLLSITDSGHGMDAETKEQIFDPFFSTKGEQGTGLGLSQVYGFIERSKGAINIYSELGQGTQLTLYFPRYNDTNHKEISVENNTVVDEDYRGTETILIVDDEPYMCSLSKEILSSYGFNIITADNAQKALEILNQNKVDLLLSDIIMPDMDGYQLAAIVREKYPKIKIQLSSGFGDTNNAHLVDKDLKDNLLSKPFNSMTLIQRIKSLLNHN